MLIKLKKQKQELLTLRETKRKGHMIRAKMHHIEYGENPSKCICSFEKSNYITKTMTHLKEPDGKIV